MDHIAEYMNNRKWAEEEKSRRMHYLTGLARKSRQDRDIAGKIGGMLIYNQVIEQQLANIVEMSIYYIKAAIWPETIQLEISLDKATFGKVIEDFRQYATVEDNRDRILSYLKKFNAKRNQVVHDLFDIPDLAELSRERDSYADLADETIKLLDDYHTQVCQNFCLLDTKKQFCHCQK